MTFFKTFLFAFVLGGAAYAQPVIAGVKVGVPFTDAFTNNTNNDAVELLLQPQEVLRGSGSSYTIGPFVEVRLPFNFSIEADALYRSLKFTETAVGSSSTSQWDFPILAKYRFLKGPVRPYVAGGLDFNHVSGIVNLVTANHNTSFGVALGAGVEIHALVMRISPEIRWTGDALKNFSGVVSSNQNQVALLVGIGF